MRLAAALAILGVAFSARADSVSNEIFVNAAQAIGATPRSSLFTDTLRASFDLGEDWTLSAAGSLTLPGASTRYGDRGSAVTLFTLGADWSATENLTLGVTADISPKSTQFAETVATLRNGQTVADGEIRSETSQLGLGTVISWDTLGSSNLEWSFDLGLDFSHYAIDQSVAVVGSRPGAQQPRQGSLDFERVSGTVLATLFADTDLSLSGDYYFYNQDPALSGDFALATQGRAPNLPIAPLQYLVQPEVLHRFGSFSAKAWLQAGQYVAGTGNGTAAVGLKLQYRFTKAWRAWVTAAGQRDVDAGQNVTRSGTISVGAGYRW